MGAAEDLTSVVRLLVDEPRAVSITAGEGAGAVRLDLSVAPGDRGKVIGRRGRTIEALRALVDTRGEREGRSYAVEVLDD